MNNKIYTMKMTPDFATVVEEFQKKLPQEEEIVSTAINGEWFIVTTRRGVLNTKSRNLLLEECRKKNV